MTRSSPVRSQFSSPDHPFRAAFFSDQRNTELSHRDALAAAQVEHERVREAALRAYEMHELKEEHRRIVDQGRKEEERLKAEARVAAEERRLQELRTQTVPKPAPPPPPPPPEPESEPKPTPETAALQAAKPASPGVKKPAQTAVTRAKTAPQQPPAGPQQLNGLPANQNKPAAAPAPSAAVGPAIAAPAPQTKRDAAPDRYVQIHQELKALRRDLLAQSKTPGSPLKGKMGTFRREIRVAIGQLTGGRGANTQPVCWRRRRPWCGFPADEEQTSKIMAVLRESLGGQVPSPPVQVSRFVLEPREAVEGATHNDETLPALFIYLVNICAKGVISQFINECGPNPKAADPIGVFTAQLFSHRDFQWRGQSLIDMLMAKFRVVCPVLFGFRGSERTEKGRLAIGWRRDGPAWITEQSHNDRMAGLGAGFASISLRDFSKASKANPYPPTNYWKALAAIVNSPAGETSNTQCVVLRSMIDGHEQRFLQFYGNAAVAALRLALVEFPKRAPENAPAAASLLALREVIRTEGGLALA